MSFVNELEEAVFKLQHILKRAGVQHGALEIRLATQSDGRAFENAVRMDPEWVRLVPDLGMRQSGPLGPRYQVCGVAVDWPKTRIY